MRGPPPKWLSMLHRELFPVINEREKKVTSKDEEVELNLVGAAEAPMSFQVTSETRGVIGKNKKDEGK